jgi:hypothetical protein
MIATKEHIGDNQPVESQGPQRGVFKNASNRVNERAEGEYKARGRSIRCTGSVPKSISRQPGTTINGKRLAENGLRAAGMTFQAAGNADGTVGKVRHICDFQISLPMRRKE